MKSIKKYINSLPNWVKNRYFLAGFGFLVWMSFLDTNSFITQYELSQEISNLEKAKHRYEELLQTDIAALEELSGGDFKLEKYAREKHRMCKENEDVFIIQVPEELKLEQD